MRTAWMLALFGIAGPTAAVVLHYSQVEVGYVSTRVVEDFAPDWRPDGVGASGTWAIGSRSFVLGEAVAASDRGKGFGSIGAGIGFHSTASRRFNLVATAQLKSSQQQGTGIETLFGLRALAVPGLEVAAGVGLHSMRGLKVDNDDSRGGFIAYAGLRHYLTPALAIGADLSRWTLGYDGHSSWRAVVRYDFGDHSRSIQRVKGR